MPQSGRIGVSTVTESKMFAKKMHRLVKKMQDKPADSLEMLTEMARKGGQNLAFPLEVDNETAWQSLLKKEGLIVADVHSGWCGPCTSMFSILRKLKLDTNDDRLMLVAANADNISQLAPFRNQSEPCWLFLGGGKPVKVLRGSNAPKLVKTIKSEFQHELDCIEGKNQRSLISIKFESSRREQAINEVIGLDELIKLEEEEKKPKEVEPPPVVEEDANEEGIEDEQANAENAESTEIEEQGENDEENDDTKDDSAEKEQEANEAEELLKERRKLMEESSVKLQEALRKYTVIAIQTYLLETGAVTEIKDRLSSDFNLVRERYINLNDDGARKLFGIPAEMPDPNPTPEEVSQDDDDANEGEGLADDENPRRSQSRAPSPVPSKADSDQDEKEGDDENKDGSDGENDDNTSQEKKKVVRMIPIPVPELIIGDTLILLVECTKPIIIHKKESIENDEDGEIQEEEIQDADYYITRRTGPEDFELATETEPESLNAIYGKEKYVAGIWCPRNYEDKRFVMLNYFPQFVTEMLMPPIPDPPKYQLFVYSALFSSEIMEHPEYIRNKQDVIAEKRTRIPHKISENMLFASKREGERLRTLKWALTGTEVLLVSINGKNIALTQLMDCFNPIFSIKETPEAGYFTGKLFKDVEVLIDDEPFLQAELEPQPLQQAASNLANLVDKLREDMSVIEDEKSEEESEENEEKIKEIENAAQNEESVEGKGNQMDSSAIAADVNEQEIDNEQSKQNSEDKDTCENDQQ